MSRHDQYTKEQLESIGKRLKKIRKEKGYSNYEQFAFTHNIGRAQYGRYENGSDMRISSLIKVLKAFDMTVEEFFAVAIEEEE